MAFDGDLELSNFEITTNKTDRQQDTRERERKERFWAQTVILSALTGFWTHLLWIIDPFPPVLN